MVAAAGSPVIQRGVLLEGGAMSDDVQPLDAEGPEPAPEPAAQAEEAGGGEAAESAGATAGPASPGGGCDSILL